MTGGFHLDVIASVLQLGYMALFAVLNPLGNTLIFRAMTAHGTPLERSWLARRVAVNSFVVMVAALFGGPYLLGLFGLSVNAIRVAGGLMIGFSAWRMLNDDPASRGNTVSERVQGPLRDMSVVPLTIPLTAGPATISILIAYGSVHSAHRNSDLSFYTGVTLAAVAAAITVWLAYHHADRIAHLLGPMGERTATRLIAFLLLCVGAQMFMTGEFSALKETLAPR